jgi:competence protein ComEC
VVRKWLAAVTVALAVLGLVFSFDRPDGQARLIILDVGQGGAVLIQQGYTEILIDGGPSPQALINELGRRLPFWDRTIELVVLTHPHEDHLSGLVEVLKRYDVRAVLQPPIEDAGDSNGLVAEWRSRLTSERARVVTAAAYQEITLGGITLSVVNPPEQRPGGAGSDPDNDAVVVEAKAGGFIFLLASDIGREPEIDLLHRRLVADCDILLVAHHGSDISTSQEFLNVTRPEVAVISVGENSFGHPGEAVLARLEGCSVFRTDASGSVEFITGGGRLRVKTSR